MSDARLPRADIMADEIGLEIGIFGDYRLKSVFQPIFALQDGYLAPLAIEGLVVPYVRGRPFDPELFVASLPAAGMAVVGRLMRALHLRNYRNIGASGLQLFFDYRIMPATDDAELDNEIRLLRGLLDADGPDPSMVFCQMVEAAFPDLDDMAGTASALRALGIGASLGDFGPRASSIERLEKLQPAIVKFDVAWFRKLCVDSATAHLFASVVSHLRSRGVVTLAKGIDNPGQLGIALQAGVDLLQGDFLARPALAGTIFDESLLEVSQLLRRDTNVVTFPMQATR